MRSSSGFAGRHPGSKYRNLGSHWYASAMEEKDVIPVTVVEDPSGDHWAWWEEEIQKFRYLHWNRGFVVMCFAGDVDAYEAAGRGALLRVRVEEE